MIEAETTITGGAEMVEAALDLAELGYHVFPCRPRGKEPLTGNGFKAATRDERTILHWWDAHPTANVGIACGASGIVVLDVDVKVEGERALDALDDLELDLELGPRAVRRDGVVEVELLSQMYARAQVLTGLAENGWRGSHVYFRGRERACKTTAPGIELRGAGAYVLAPGSVHPSGARYEILDGLAGVDYPAWRLPAVEELPELPASVRAILPVAEPRARPVERWRELARDGVGEGERNCTVASLAGHLLARRVDPLVALELVRGWNASRNRPPLPDAEVIATVDSIAARELRKWT